MQVNTCMSSDSWICNPVSHLGGSGLGGSQPDM